MAPWHVDPGPPGDPKGRRVIADKRFRPGDVVLRDQPYAAVLYDDQVARRCDCCLEAADNLLRCAGCKLAHYKNRDHQLRAWRSGHREECAALKQLAPRVPPPTIRLAARAWLQHYSAAAGAGAKPGGGGTSSGSPGGSDRYGEVLSLQHHWEQLQDGHKIQYAQMAALAWQLVRLANPQAAEGVTPRDLAQLIARFAANNHTICDDELRPVGVGIYPLVSLVNHSCQPNCMQSFQGSTLVLRAVRPIAPGDEVTITYVELGATRWERRASLLAQYYFDIDSPAAGEAGQQPGTASAPAAGQVAAGAAERAQQQQQQQQQEERTAGAAWEGEAPGKRCTQEEPVVQPDRTLQLSDSVQLRLYYGSAAPPWPHDPRDLELTAVQWAGLTVSDTPRTAAAAAAAAAAAGGMWAELVMPQPTSPGLLAPGSSAGSGGSWGAAAESFPVDFAALGLGAEPASGPGCGSGSWAGGSEKMEGPGAADSTWVAHSAARGSAASVAPQVMVHCWLGSELCPPKGSAHSAAADGSEVEGASVLQQQQQQQQQADTAAAALAGAYARALLQLQAAEELLGGGGSGNASSMPRSGGSEGAATVAPAFGAPAGATPAGSAAAAAQLLEHALAAIGAGSGISASPGSQGQQAPQAEHSTAATAQRASQGPMHVRRRPPAGSTGLPSAGLHLGPRHVLRMRLLAAGVRAAVAAGDQWEAALGWMRQLLPLYEFVYPEVWPNLGLHWAGIAKLEHFLGGRPQAAQHAAQRAAAILACTHGESSGFGGQGVMADVKRVLFEASQELKLSGR